MEAAKGFVPLVIVLLGVLPDLADGLKKTKSAERRLYDDLLYLHNPSSRPVMNANSTIRVHFSLMLTQLMDLVEKNQTLITQVTVTQEWIDEILQWDPQNYEGIKAQSFPSRDVWVPDLYVFNNAENGYEGILHVNDSRVLIKHTGEVFWSIPMIIKSSCAVDVKYFPFDNQRCSVRIGSWLHDGNHLDLVLKKGGFDMTSYITNDEFHLLSIQLEREVLSREEFSMSYFNVVPLFSTSPDSVYPQMVLSLHMQRNPLYHLYTIVAPTIVLCIMMLFSFLLPCESGDKVGIGLTVFLSLYVLQLAIAENIPESNSLPLISLFLTLVMTLNSLSLMFSTLVINIKKKGDRKPCQAVPECILWFCHKVLAKITFTRKLEFRDFYTTCMDEEKLLKRVAVRNPSEDLTALCKVTRGHDLIKSVLESSQLRNRKSFSEGGEGSDNNLLDTPNMHRERRPSKFASCSSKLLMHNKNRKLEWYFVAEVTDKILFLLFLLALLVTVLTSLWIVPELHRYD